MVRPGLTNLCHEEKFPWQTSFISVPAFFNFFCPTSVSVLSRICVYTTHTHTHTYIYIYLTAWKHIYITVTTKYNDSTKLLHNSGAMLSVNWIFITLAPPWHWMERCTIRSINRRPNCPNDSQKSKLFPVKRQLQCCCNNTWSVSTGSCYLHSVFTLMSANSQYQLTNSKNKCLHTEVKILRQVTNIDTVIYWNTAYCLF